MKISIASLLIALLFAPNMAIAYSQDPRSCADPRTNYPTPMPPCNK